MYHSNTPTSHRYSQDMAKGFGRFVDEVLRGRENKAILNGSVGLAALETGVPAHITDFDIGNTIINNSKFYSEGALYSQHPLFEFNEESFTLFGLDFKDLWRQLHGEDSLHHTPFYTPASEGGIGGFNQGDSLAGVLNLPDLPYGGMAHLAHMGMALYDTGRTFQDLWKDPALKKNVFKIVTHPEMGHTLAHRGVMLSVMGLLHPLGAVVSIGVAYLCAHLVHSFFQMLDNNKEGVQAIAQVPVLREIYNATGIKEWAEAKKPHLPDEGSIADINLSSSAEHANAQPTLQVQSASHTIDRVVVPQLHAPQQG